MEPIFIKNMTDVIVIDLAMKPDHWKVEDWVNIMKKWNILFCDSEVKSNYHKPFMLSGKDIEGLILDLSTKEGKEKIEKLIIDKLNTNILNK